MHITDIRKSLSRVSRIYNDLCETRKLVLTANGDTVMIEAYLSTLKNAKALGHRLANCYPNGELLYPQFFGAGNAHTQPTDAPGMVIDAVPTVDDKPTLPAWCAECDNPKSSCTCPSAFRRIG